MYHTAGLWRRRKSLDKKLFSVRDEQSILKKKKRVNRIDGFVVMASTSSLGDAGFDHRKGHAKG